MSIIGWADRKREEFEKENNKLEKLKLYHFTSNKNLESIYKNGLLGWETLENKFNYKANIDYFPCSDSLSRRLDSKKNKKNYIRLCKSTEHYMIRNPRHNDLVVLEIDKKILKKLICEFTSENATKTGVVFSNDINVFLGSEDPHAEVLVWNKIPSKFILGKIQLKQENYNG